MKSNGTQRLLDKPLMPILTYIITFIMLSLDGIVETLLVEMKNRGLSEHLTVARDLLEFKIEK